MGRASYSGRGTNLRTQEDSEPLPNSLLATYRLTIFQFRSPDLEETAFISLSLSTLWAVWTKVVFLTSCTSSIGRRNVAELGDSYPRLKGHAAVGIHRQPPHGTHDAYVGYREGDDQSWF
jgi:hypothetical protein